MDSKELINILVVAAMALVFPAIMLLDNMLKKRRRAKLKALDFPDAWKRILASNVSIYRHLTDQLKNQLHEHINVFLGEKRFEGCEGIEISDEIKVTIAGYACIMLLNRKTDYYPTLSTILVYPHSYFVEEIADTAGSEHVLDHAERAGESWAAGTVVLAWDEVKHEALDIADGYNVALHEFAHQLDEESGDTDGVPLLRSGRYKAWTKVMDREYKELVRKTRARQQDVIDDYGAENPAEFFAVATEAFFETPRELREKHRALYAELKNYFQLDPAEWEKH